jgi:hypothetical protein
LSTKALVNQINVWLIRPFTVESVSTFVPTPPCQGRAIVLTFCIRSSGGAMMTPEEVAYLERAVAAVLAALPDDSERAAVVLKRAMARRLCSVSPEVVGVRGPQLWFEPQPIAA